MHPADRQRSHNRSNPLITAYPTTPDRPRRRQGKTTVVGVSMFVEDLEALERLMASYPSRPSISQAVRDAIRTVDAQQAAAAS
ncbi:ribbon-helix-helix domain-containing protein [Paludisphaera rhizosphaerae]|uniref:hypothetical protein n=1 Tax=Paludisphaera rhizosphaerae TaxID=2711216 RepID=UPI0013ED7272|nr:hypothetical protein [Paludisphaera rhizosphaerae]